MMPDFSKARQGDSVFSILCGSGTVKWVDPGHAMQIQFDSGETFTYKMSNEGKRASYHSIADLYWSKPEISDPPPPKRMKKVKGFTPIWEGFKLPGRLPYQSGHLWESVEEAELNNSDYIKIIPVEFEVEDE